MSTIMEEILFPSSSLPTFPNNQNTSVDGVNISQNDSFYYNNEEEIGRLITLVCYPIIILVGTIGNILTFIVMQRGSLKHSSTCFYMAVLALSDTSK